MIAQKDIMNNKIKQTSASVLTLCYVLPYILVGVVSNDCIQWQNFVRLLQIVLLCTSSYADVDTASGLDQLIVTHHLLFTEIYPKANVKPKMHYCLHLSRQLLIFGPLRNQWCMRFEASCWMLLETLRQSLYCSLLMFCSM
jgi:hypothetical protein